MLTPYARDVSGQVMSAGKFQGQVISAIEAGGGFGLGQLGIFC